MAKIAVLITDGEATGQIVLTESQQNIILNLIGEMHYGDIKAIKTDFVSIGKTKLENK
jgi:hypothetical protein